jgi:tetratricopeptide (TPR) repeat protein/CHAT domain-containing protein
VCAEDSGGGNVVKSSLRISISAIIITAALAIGSTPSGAQQADIQTIYKRYEEFRTAGNYSAALLEAQKYEAATRAKFGADHPSYAFALNLLAIVYQAQGKYADAEPRFQRALAIWEKTLGASHPNVAAALVNVANVYQAEGRYADAEPLYRRALGVWEKALGASHPNVGATLNYLAMIDMHQGKYDEAETLSKRALAINETHVDAPKNLAANLNTLATIYQLEGKYGEAERFYQRAIAVLENAFGTSDSQVALTLNNLADVDREQGKYSEAERLFQRSIAIEEKNLGTDHPNLAPSLNNLARIYTEQGKYVEAEGLYRRALAITEKALGAEHPDVSIMLLNLANLYSTQGKYADAEPLFQRSLAITEKVLGPDHPTVAYPLAGLANIYRGQGRYAAAEPLYKRALAISQNALGASHPDVALILTNLAPMYHAQGKYADAELLYRRALEIWEKALGANHPKVATTLDGLARLYAAQDNWVDALAFSRRATAAAIAHGLSEVSAAQLQESSEGIIQQEARYFRNHLADLAVAARKNQEPIVTLGAEAFEIAQWASQSSAAAAVQQMSTRFGSGSDALAILVRRTQDLAARWRDNDKTLVAMLSKPEGQQDRAAIEALRKQIADTVSKLTAVAAQLDKEFPDYTVFTTPKPLNVEEVQKLLGPTDALVFFLAGDAESYVFALTRDGFDWKVIPLGGDVLAQKIAAFRRGLDIDEINKAIKESKNPELFDLDLANELCATLLGPVEPLIKDKKQLLIVPSGALTALPFDLLVTEKSAAPRPDKMSGYRDAAWLIRRHAITVLPSVASVKALRAFARKDEAKKPMVGFGDPAFNLNAAPAGGQRIANNAGARSLTTRSYTDFWRGAEVDRARLAEALLPLPDTAVELKAVAKDLNAPVSDIHLDKDANETEVKRLPLADYRVVYFATHALVAGDVKGLGEPALALSTPAQPSDLDDGLLTASEVAQLKLNADWVVLSACNTVAGDRPGAEALSGLARAFFYAGARALLVSHWAVSSDAATRLTTSTFDILKANPTIGRAEALRRAELAYLNDTSDPRNAYPAFWGPFEIVGEGDVR